MQTALSNAVIFSEVEHELLGSHRPGSHSFNTEENHEGLHLVAIELLGCDMLTIIRTTSPSEMPSKN